MNTVTVRGRRTTRALRRTWVGGVAIAVGAASTLALLTAPVSAAPSSCATTSQVAAAEAEAEATLLSRLNSLRTGRGLSTLANNADVGGPAALWSETMAAQNWLHHARDTGPNDGVEPHQDYVRLVSESVPGWTRVAENIGYRGVSSWCSAAAVRSAAVSAANALHDSFVTSSSHFKNMVGGFNQVGIGVHVDADRLWATVRFVHGPVGSSAEAAKYVDAVHRLFINRGATSGDVTKWAPSVRAGDRNSMTLTLAASDEWAGVRVAELYRTVLGRSPDAGGRGYWVARIADGVRLEDVAAGFYASDEYFRRTGNTNTGFVTGLYQDILGRSPDGPGRAHWVRLLDRRIIDRSTAAANFYASIESRRDRVVDLYREILGRSVDSGGLQYWADTLLSTGDVVLASFLASSDEYYRRVT